MLVVTCDPTAHLPATAVQNPSATQTTEFSMKPKSQTLTHTAVLTEVAVTPKLVLYRGECCTRDMCNGLYSEKSRTTI